MTGKVITLVILILGLTVFGVYDYYIGYKYESKIGAYMENAKDMNTPSRMIEQLELAKKGMTDEGLTERDYGAYFFKKPSNSMSFQFQHIDSILERAHAVEEWRAEVYGNSSVSVENLGDVYEAKMTNLRKFIMEDGRSDWIAENAWYIKNHIFMYFDWVFILFFMLGIIVTILLITFEAAQ